MRANNMHINESLSRKSRKEDQRQTNLNLYVQENPYNKVIDSFLTDCIADTHVQSPLVLDAKTYNNKPL